MTDSRKTLITKRLKEEGDKTLAFFRALTADQWSLQIYTDGSGWTIREIACHLLNVEMGFHALITDILAGGPGAPEGMVIDEYNEEQVGQMDGSDVRAVLDAFAAARASTVALVQGMCPEDFDREGRHPYFGVVPVGKMLKLIYHHTMLHQRDIRRALDMGAPVDGQDERTRGVP
jgi:hypothetical protein